MRNAPVEANGFSLAEVVVAMLILTVGFLAMAGTTGHVFNRLQQSSRETERTVAVQHAVEEIRAQPFDDVDSRGEAQALTVGHYKVWWEVEPASSSRKVVRIQTRGPGYLSSGAWTDTLVTTTLISVYRP